MKQIVLRDKYLAKIHPFVQKPIIKVLVGQRRVGKSYLLKLIREKDKRVQGKNIIWVDKESDEFSHITNTAELTKYINEHSVKGDNMLFIDEIQEIEHFENSIRSFAAKPGYDIYITGSNSQMLSGELSGRLSGRYIEIPVYSLDYEEFLKFHKLESSEAVVWKYMRYGGMPFLANLDLKDDVVFEYLKNVFTSILYRDIITRYNIRNANFLDRLVKFAADNIGSVLTAKKISDYLKSQKMNISINIVLDYLHYLVNSHIIIPCRRYDLQGKRFFEVGEKYYFQDLGIRNGLVGYKITDRGKLIENAVFCHLLSHGYKVYTGDWQKYEIDFIAEKNNETVYIQVALTLSGKGTQEREFGNLKKIEDNYPKYVISMDKQEGNSVEGILHWSLEKFLLEFH